MVFDSEVAGPAGLVNPEPSPVLSISLTARGRQKYLIVAAPC